MAEDQNALLVLTGEIVSAYVGNNNVRPEALPDLIRNIRATLAEDTSPPEPEETLEPTKLTAAQIRRSITPSGLISFVDGNSYKTLKRHVAKAGMTMDEYKARFGLPKDYPSTAPEYSARRSEMARSLGLGARGRGSTPDPVAPEPAAAEPAETESAPAKKRGRKPAAAPSEG